MNKLLKYLLSMHYVTIEVLIVVAVVGSLGRGFLVNIIAAVLAASALDIALKMLWLKQRLTLPLSAIITGLIVGLVTPFGTNILAVIIPSVLAVLSKFFIRMKGSHVFNPAVFGVVASMLLFSSIASHVPPEAAGHMSSGANIGGFAVNLLLVPLLVYASYSARKLWISIPNLITAGLLYFFTGLATANSLIQALPYFFSFIIASEPKTTPNTRNQQIIFGIGIAILPFFPLLIGQSYDHVGALVSLLIGNLAFAVCRSRFWESSKVLPLQAS